MVYHRYINIIKGTEQTHEVFTRYIQAIWMTCPYGFDIPGINHVYTTYIQPIWTYGCDIPGIYHVYTWYINGNMWYTCYIPGIYSVYTRYIQCIYIAHTQYITIFYSTRWLVLRRRAGSHSPRTPSYHIAWARHDFYFAPLLTTLGILALGNVDAQGTPGTENSREMPCLTGKTHKPIYLDFCHPAHRRCPNHKGNQSNC